jgi:hypothetical protein
VRPPRRLSVIFILGFGVEEILGAAETAKTDSALVHGVVFAKVLAADLAPAQDHLLLRSLALDALAF